MKKTILIPAGIAEKIIHFKPENRLLSAIGQFSPERRNFCHFANSNSPQSACVDRHFCCFAQSF